jgi:hypothetical protein
VSGNDRDARCYAGVATRAHVATRRSDSSSTLDEGRNEATRRWSRDEHRARVAGGAPQPRYPWLEESALDALARAYERITGDRIIRPAQRKYLALVARIHGPETEARIAARFAATGTATNLLGHLRITDPDAFDAVALTAGIVKPVSAAWTPDELVEINPGSEADPPAESDWIAELDELADEPIDLLAEAHRIFGDDLAAPRPVAT